MRAYVLGMGIVSPVGSGLSATTEAIRRGTKGLRPLSLFPAARESGCLVGEITEPTETTSIRGTEGVPRTHQLARLAAAQAMAGSRVPPDAVVVGTTTGGMLTTETLLKRGERDPALYRYHSLGSVAEDLALRYRCTGPVITVSTACSSGAVAIKVALEMLRSGKARRILAGGADSLCRLTYYGFNALQLLDPGGARPLDRDRRGMSLAEGAAMLLLTADEPDGAIAEILGAGVSCDAYHPTAPDPMGRGAARAMEAAIQDAGITRADVGYINLHGTGTPDNDLSEAMAIDTVFGDRHPLLSSIKGAFGHSLGAAGAVEAVVSAIGISQNLVPANTGYRCPDPALKLDPVIRPTEMPPSAVLSNSFGFGGNNASIVMGPPGTYSPPAKKARAGRLAIVGTACITGAGDTAKTLEALSGGRPCLGQLSLGEISRDLPAAEVRRLKRLPRLVLSLAVTAHDDSGRGDYPASIFLGTGWGALSETYSFLRGLFQANECFSSPTDFVGAVHNAPACQAAMRFKATGANITTTGGDYSFEQSVMVADLMTRDADGTILVVGADEAHPELSELFDPSVLPAAPLSDGGGAFCLRRGHGAGGPGLTFLFFENSRNNPGVIASLVRTLGTPKELNGRYGAVLAGIPGCCRRDGEEQLRAFLAMAGFEGPAVDYRRLTGEYASASAVATVAAARFVEQETIPGPLCSGGDAPLNGKGVLILGLGGFVTAMAVTPQ
jgi:3-oxoacyl-(acyl-carrier-protein) synthase